MDTQRATLKVKKLKVKSGLGLGSALVVAVMGAGPAWGAVVGTGDVVPGAPAGWTSATVGYVGNTGIGGVTVDGGSTLFSGTGYVGFGLGSIGTLSVDGTGSNWTNSSVLYVGDAGSGMLSVTNGGTVTSSSNYVGDLATGAGTINLSGTSTLWKSSGTLYLGNYGIGSLSISSGAQGSVTSTGYLGFGPQSLGLLTVDGTGSKFTVSGALYIGNSGTGSLSVTNGGTLSIPNVYLGYNASGVGAAIIDGTGSKWTGGNSLYVGYSGGGTLTVRHAGTISITSSLLGYNTSGVGVAIVDGTGSTWATATLFVGYYGAGTLNIANGGGVNVSAAMWVGYGPTATGTINFGTDGGTLTSRSLFAAAGQFTGTGAINTRGLVTDGSLLFDATHGTKQMLNWLGDHENVGVSLDLTGGSSIVGDLGAGYLGGGTLTIQGATVTGGAGYLAYKAGSAGVATIDGTDSKWTSYGNLYVGNSGTGSLSVRNGGQVSNAYGYLGYSTGSTGTATINGTGSSWANTYLYAGYSGAGVMVIANGGKATSAGGFLGYGANASGIVTVDGSGSVWTDDGGLDIGGNGMGVLTISHGGKVSSSSGQLGGVGGTGIVTVDGSGSTWTNNGVFVGRSGCGILTISHGGSVSSTEGYLGYDASAAGTVTVHGSGSTWTSIGASNNGGLIVGSSGMGALNITSGGKVSDRSGYLGFSAGASGVASVDGVGSTWINSRSLTIGGSGVGVLSVINGGLVTVAGPLYGANGTGNGTVKISNGGSVTAVGVIFNSRLVLMMSVGDGSSLSAGSGTLTNSGAIQLSAIPNATAGTYMPISAGSWTGGGTVTALGGNWNSTTHVFTVATAQGGAAGSAVGIDTSLAQRVVITDATSNRSVWLGFQGTSTASNLTVSATPLTEGEVGGLATKVTAGGVVLGGWEFTTSGYTAGSAVGVSMEVGAGYSTEGLQVWHWDGAAWASYAATDLSYDGRYANFTVTGFSGYGIVAVPEVGTVGMLGLGVMGLMWRRRRDKGRGISDLKFDI